MLPEPVSVGASQLRAVVRARLNVCLLTALFRRRMISVMSLRRRGAELAFVELARFDGVSHIRCLRNTLVGCGVQGDADLPCLLDWKTGRLCTLPPSPVGDVCDATPLIFLKSA